MKKITIVDAKRIISYLNSVSFDNFYMGNIMRAANSGKNHYEVPDVFAFFVNSVHFDLESKRAVTNNQLSKYLHVIRIILEAYNENEYFAGEELIKKVEALSGLYIDNRNSTGKEGDAKIIDILEVIKKEAIQNLEYKKGKSKISKPNAEEPEKEIKDEPALILEKKSVEEYESLVAKFQSKIASLETEIANIELALKNKTAKELKDAKEICKLNKKIDELKELNAELRKAKKSVEKENSNLEKQIEKLNRKIEGLGVRIEELIKRVEDLTLEKDALLVQAQEDSQKINSLIAHVEEQDKALEVVQLTLEGVTTKQELLDDFILNLLFERKRSIHELIEVLLKNGFDVTEKEVLASLRRINHLINVKPIPGFKKEYGIVEPTYQSNVKINYPNHNSRFDVVLLADYHYDGGDSGSYLESKLDSVYNYCASNNVKTIITLGDLIDNKNIPAGMNKEIYGAVRQLLENFDKILPYDVKIKHLVLGGNHDRGFFKYGIDPLAEMSFNREDVISLGYSNAYMFFGGSDVLGLHHEGVPRENIIPDLSQSGNETLENIKRNYNTARVNIANRYLDLFGHFHKSRIDMANAFAVVPSLNADRNTDGALHITFELDSSGRINNVLIRNLIFGRGKELRTVHESVIQRTKNKPN